MNSQKSTNTIKKLPMYRFADIAVTHTADEIHGIYRGKKHHEQDFSEVLARAEAIGCSKIMLTTMNLQGARRNLEVCKRHSDQCYMTLGVHPYHAAELYDGLSTVEDILSFRRSLLAGKDNVIVAFGEIGLDYHYLDRASKELQQKAFRDQLEAATTLDLPLFLHIRDSYDDFVALIKPFLLRLPRRGIVHSFAGTKDEMLGLVELGFDISVNGVSFKNEHQIEMVRNIPLDHLQLETDTPWCEIPSSELVKEYLKDATPLPPSRKHSKFVRGEMVKGRNESCVIERVARVVAGCKGIPLDTVTDAAWRNSVRMFGLGGIKC